MPNRRFTYRLALAIATVLTSNSFSQQASTSQSARTSAGGVANPTTHIHIEIEPRGINFPSWLKGNSANARQVVELVKDAAGDSNFHVAIDIPGSVSQPVVRLLVKADNSDDVAKAKTALAKVSLREPVEANGFVVGSPTHEIVKDVLEIDETLIPVDRERFAAAKQQVSRFPIRIAFVPPAHVWETYDELLPELPNHLGGGPTSILTEGIEWAAVGIEPQEMNLELTIQSKNANAAQALAQRLPDMVTKIMQLLPDSFSTFRASVESILKLANHRVEGDQIHITVDGTNAKSPRDMLASILGEAHAPIATTSKRNRMRQILLGVINYESANGSFPPAKRYRGKDGASGLSWRVHILPYIEEIELYQQFHLDEPWNSPHNIKLLERMPEIYNAYANIGLIDPVLKAGYTTFVAPVGDGTILGGNEVTKIRNIKDGTSKTLLLVEVDPKHAVPWTAPQDYAYSPDDPGEGLAWDRNGNVGVGFCDGAWMLLPKSTSKQTLRDLFQMNDGRAIDLK